MAWIMDTYSMHMRQTVTAVVTGKPLNIGGSRGRREATGRGVMIVCDEAIKQLGMPREDYARHHPGLRQRRLECRAADAPEQGYKIVGIGEWDGGLYNSNGIDIAALLEYRQKQRHHPGLPRAPKRPITEELLITDCDVLIPAATENVITSRNADRVKARILVEGANGPTTAAADDILADKNIFVIPDILANAGGVTASYFEWVQDRQGFFWKESWSTRSWRTSWRGLHRCAALRRDARVNNRIAAYMLAIDRVAFTISTAAFTPDQIWRLISEPPYLPLTEAMPCYWVEVPCSSAP